MYNFAFDLFYQLCKYDKAKKYYKSAYKCNFDQSKCELTII